MAQQHEIPVPLISHLLVDTARPMLRNSKIRHFLIGGAIGGLCLVMVLRKVGIEQSWRVLRHVNGNWVCVALLVSACNLLLRAWRWQSTFPERSRPTLARCVQVLAIGNMGNNVLPGRLGDLARCTLIRGNLSAGHTGEAVATLGVEKVADGCALFAILFVSITVLTPPQWIWQLSFLSGLMFAAVLIFILALRFWAEWVTARIAILLKLVGLGRLTNRVSELLASFARAIREIKSGKQLIPILAITAAIWMTEAGLIWAMAASVSIAVAGKAAIFVAALIGLGLVIPAAPAALGTYEAFGVAAFSTIGMSASSSLAVTLLLHAWVLVTTCCFGLLSLGWAGQRFGRLFRRSDKMRPTSTLDPQGETARTN
jgi:uncharacterized protein (TIRG00374 family)